MSRIAFTKYEKVLVELRSALRGDEWDKQEFIDRMKLINEMMIDQTPIADRFASRYNKNLCKHVIRMDSSSEIFKKVDLKFKKIADLIVGESFLPLLFDKYKESIMVFLKEINDLLDSFDLNYPFTCTARELIKSADVTNSFRLLKKLNEYKMFYNIDSDLCLSEECYEWLDFKKKTIVRYYNCFRILHREEIVCFYFVNYFK